MAYQVLARKWRPKTFDEVMGQGHVIRSLKNSVVSKRLAQSYLLSGTRGVGKTTIARIMAKALRCESLTTENNPCNECNSCLDVDSGSSLDVVEVDGASNNSVENVREIISNLHYSPTFGDKRIVIIDEVHMLSISAFNALLKTLEEPPAHVVFIFATTEPHKIPKTVLSRVQQFDLRDIKISEMKEQLSIIAKAEEFSFEGNVQDTLCSIANGSMRDLLSLVEQLLLFCEDRVITEETVRESLGIIESAKVKLMTDHIYRGHVSELVSDLELIFQGNINLEHLVFSMCEEFYRRLNDALKGNSSEEHFIFETFSKDSAHILESIAPELSFKASVIKLAKRFDYFREGEVELKNSSSVSEAPKSVEKHLESTKSENISQIQSGDEQTSSVVEESIPEPVKESSIKKESLAKEEIKTEEKNQNENENREQEVDNSSENVEVTEKTQPERIYTWEAFSEWLMEKSPALSSTIEQGNFTTEVNLLLEKEKVTLKFEEDSMVFYEHIQETDGENKLKKFLAEFFSREVSQIDLTVELIKQNEEESFRSMANIKEDEYQKTLSDRENGLRESDLIKLAQEMFDSKLDKVIANKEI